MSCPHNAGSTLSISRASVLMIGVLSVVHYVQARLLHEQSFSAPFSAFDASGTRRVPGWKLGGNTRAKMGGLRLTAEQPGQRGDVFAHSNVDLGNEFSFESKFRMSGEHSNNVGESIAWVIANGKTKAITEPGDWYGIQRHFEGLAVVITTDHPAATGDARVDPQKVTLWANDGTKPQEVGSCLRQFHYDENREDFVPTLASTIRVSFDATRVVIDMDTRNTVRWYRCMSTGRAHSVLGKFNSSWRKQAQLGIVATTGSSKQENFELMSIRVFNGSQEALNSALPDDGATTDTAVRIAHHLEHGLFEVHDDIAHMIKRMDAKATRDAQRIAELESKLADKAFTTMEQRLQSMEKRLTGISAPMLEAGARRVQYTAEKRLELLKDQTKQHSTGWMRPFMIAAGMLIAFGVWAYKEYRAISKWNRAYM